MAHKQQTVIVPSKYAGQWIAWDYTNQEIIANGKTIQEVEKVAEKSGAKEVAYEWIPPANVRLIG